MCMVTIRRGTKHNISLCMFRNRRTLFCVRNNILHRVLTQRMAATNKHSDHTYAPPTFVLNGPQILSAATQPQRRFLNDCACCPSSSLHISSYCDNITALILRSLTSVYTTARVSLHCSKVSVN